MFGLRRLKWPGTVARDEGDRAARNRSVGGGGTVVAHRSWGLEVRLDFSGDTGVVDRLQIHDIHVYCDEEYWPDVGDRICARRLPARPNGEPRLISQQGPLNGFTGPSPGSLDPPPGLGPVEWDVITASRNEGFEVCLEATGDTAMVM